MHKARLNGTTKTWVLAVGLVAVAFAAGWLVAKVQNVNKLGYDEVLANRWVSGVGLLIRNVRDLEPVDPKTTQLIIGWGLNIDSVELARLYDGMSPVLKKRLAFQIPAARAIATAQKGTGSMRDRHDLLAFVDCMQKVRSKGGSVRKCFNSRTGRKTKP